ncbi:Exopolyphosphatase [hydrothermal vent metagenome]|uniref:Exopolyphosphatase n=1 Tax=hydrothermal vent metagenome TaxID=652676 RepID=A0A1W1D2X4_9ZZZZ
MAKRVCVIDIGSNSVGMVVYEKTSRFAFKMLHQAKSKVQIAQNAYKNGGYLQPEPMQRAYDVLEDFVSISKSFQVKKILCVATSALRDAPNKQEFLQKIRHNLKLNIKVIDGEKEAYFGGVAVTNLLPFQKHSISVDIGGGSTEFTLIENGQIVQSFSLNLGTVRIKELFFDTNKSQEAIPFIDEKLAILEKLNPQTLIGIGGTLRAIANSVMQSANYPLKQLHAYTFHKEALQTQLTKILQAKDKNELRMLYIKENRLEVIQPGALIVSRIIQKLQCQNIITSEVGVKEGVYLADLLRNNKHKFPANFNVSVKMMMDSYITEHSYVNQLTKLTKELFVLTHTFFELPLEYKSLLSISAKLYNVGNIIDPLECCEINNSILLQNLKYGFTHQEILTITAITGNNTNITKRYGYLLPSKKIITSLRFLLRLSEALLTHRPSKGIDFSCEFKENTLYISSKKTLYLAKEATTKLQKPQDFQITFL